MADVVEQYRGALAEFGRRVDAVRGDQWQSPTPCSEWTVRALVDHLIDESRWAPPLLAGQSLAAAGDWLAGQPLDEERKTAWSEAAEGAAAAAAQADLGATVQLSYGGVSAQDYLAEMSRDLTIHAWDLARAIGAPERLDPELVAAALQALSTRREQLAASGLFADPVAVPEHADPQTQLLGLVGRRA